MLVVLTGDSTSGAEGCCGDTLSTLASAPSLSSLATSSADTTASRSFDGFTGDPPGDARGEEENHARRGLFAGIARRAAGVGDDPLRERGEGDSALGGEGDSGLGGDVAEAGSALNVGSRGADGGVGGWTCTRMCAWGSGEFERVGCEGAGGDSGIVRVGVGGSARSDTELFKTDAADEVRLAIDAAAVSSDVEGGENRAGVVFGLRLPARPSDEKQVRDATDGARIDERSSASCSLDGADCGDSPSTPSDTSCTAAFSFNLTAASAQPSFSGVSAAATMWLVLTLTIAGESALARQLGGGCEVDNEWEWDFDLLSDLRFEVELECAEDIERQERSRDDEWENTARMQHDCFNPRGLPRRRKLLRHHFPPLSSSPSIASSSTSPSRLAVTARSPSP